MIKYSSEEGFIKPHGIKHREGQDVSIRLPKVAVGVFSRHLFEDVIEKFIIFGNCGVLDASIEDCSIIIPTLGYRDEGTSYHYVPDSETMKMNPKYKEDFINVLNEFHFDYTLGPTWTTDAFFRETTDKIKYYKSNGAKTVEMEGTVIASVCQRLNIDYFTFYYAGDNLDATVWDERSLHGLAKIDKKKEVLLLALELAKLLNKDENQSDK